MRIRRFYPEDRAMLAEWWAEREPVTDPTLCLAPYGLVAERDGEAVATGFLMTTDAGVAFIEPICGNPHSDKIVRGEALGAVGEALVEEARRRGIQHVMAITSIPAVGERASCHGFVSDGASYRLYLRSV